MPAQKASPIAANLDPHRFVLISDLHIDADPGHVEGGVNMTDSVQHLCAELLDLDPRPAAILIGGDIAHHVGHATDYAAAVQLLQPLRAAGIPLHAVLGNHDHRERFIQSLIGEGNSLQPLPGRHITVVNSPCADWYLLDSLEGTNEIPGALGVEQLQWLAHALDAHPERPALVMVHHHPDEHEQVLGLRDTRALFDVLSGRRQVKALWFGHTHIWQVSRRWDGIHLINLPPVAYVFRDECPRGWVDVQLHASGAVLQLHFPNRHHDQPAERIELAWR